MKTSNKHFATMGWLALPFAAACSTTRPTLTDVGLPPSDGPGHGDAPPRSDGRLADASPPPTANPIEPVWRSDINAARVKSPGQRMRFTAGLPFRILADGQDINDYLCPPARPPYVCPDSSMAFFVDGQNVGTVPPDPNNGNLWELRLPRGLPVGDHVVTVRFTPHNSQPVDGVVPIYITMDPRPAHANVVNLNADLILSGSTDLNWIDATVIGNGHKVVAASGYTGQIIIRNSFVTGLASFDNQVGIDVTTQAAVEISGSIFEATAPLRLVVNGSAPVTISRNEFRSTNYVTFASADPTKSPILSLAGTTSGPKAMQGNNIAAGIVLITGMSNWKIGGLSDRDSNILIGPRCVIELENSSSAVIQGNYLRHDYYGGFSQGFNLQFGSNSDRALAEHNVIRGSSWPLQSFGGEFRYNLVVDIGHDFVRSSQPGTQMHHNIFVHTKAANKGYDGAVLIYGSENRLVFDNNTIDAGGQVGGHDAPSVVVRSSGLLFGSLRNNVFSQSIDTRADWLSHSYVSGDLPEATIASPRIAVADYNAWYNPNATTTGRYAPGIVAGTAGTHDVTAPPLFTGDVPQAPYMIDEGMVWQRTYKVSQVLNYYRALYTPRPGSPLIDHGDPADGPGNDIGAVGAGVPHVADKFGLVLTPN